MNPAETLPDPAKAREYFEAKMAFTTGPVELDRARRAGRVVIVDVRTAEDYARAHIPGAISVPQDAWEQPPGLDPNRLNVVYCYSQVCHLAAAAAIRFAARAVPVCELEGGFEAWQQHRLPVEPAVKRSPGKKRPAARKQR